MNTDTPRQLTRSLRRHLLAGAVGTVALFGGIGGWAATTELSGAVIAPGMLVVEGNAKKVQHPDGGVVAELLVDEGDVVGAGQTIVRMDSTIADAELATIEKQVLQLEARRARLEAERDGRPDVPTPQELRARLDAVDAEAAMTSERRLFEDRRISRDGQKAQLREQVQQLREQIKGLDVQQRAKAGEIDLIAKELEGQRQLFAKGLTSLSQVNSLDRSTTRLEGERGKLIAEIASARGKIAEIELQLLQVEQNLRADAGAELRDVENRLATLTEDEVTARDRLKRAELKAPISGAVHLLAIHTVGGVVTAAETLMEIVPQDNRLTAEARIAPQDIDQVAIGQVAKLRLTAFNRNTTPELTGSVIRVSADLETDEALRTHFFRIAIAIPSDELQRLHGLALVPGMPVEAFVRTGDRSVISYLAKPIRDHLERVFRQD